MKPLVRKKTNPAFKRLQVLPLLPDSMVRSGEGKQPMAAPAVVIVASQPERRVEAKSF